MSEVRVGEGRVVQLLQRQPAGVELRLGVFHARAEAVVRRRVIGELVVAGLQRRADQPLAHAPQRLAGLVSWRRPGQKGRHGKRQHAVPLAQHQLCAFEGDAGIVLQAGRQGLDQRQPGPEVALANAHARPRKGLLVGRQQGQQVPGGRPLLAIEQHVGAPDVVVDGEQVAEACEHLALGLGLEHLLQPEAADQVLGVLGPAERAVGGRQGHGAFWALRLLAVEPGDHGLGRQRLGFELLLGADLAAGGPGPAPEVAAGLVELGEGHALCGLVGHDPEHQLARDGVGQSRPQRIGAGGVALLGRAQRLAQGRHVVGRRRGGIAERGGLGLGRRRGAIGGRNLGVGDADEDQTCPRQGRLAH